MALSRIQTDVLGLLAANRDPESYVAGATPLNRNAPRYAYDIGVFHDREDRVAAAAALGIAGGDEVPDPLLAATNDPEVSLRRAAVKSLGSFDDPRSGPALDERTEDEDRETAIRAAEALFALARQPRAAPEARARLDSSSAWAVQYARIVEEVSA